MGDDVFNQIQDHVEELLNMSLLNQRSTQWEDAYALADNARFLYTCVETGDCASVPKKITYLNLWNDKERALIRSIIYKPLNIDDTKRLALKMLEASRDIARILMIEPDEPVEFDTRVIQRFIEGEQKRVAASSIVGHEEPLIASPPPPPRKVHPKPKPADPLSFWALMAAPVQSEAVASLSIPGAPTLPSLSSSAAARAQAAGMPVAPTSSAAARTKPIKPRVKRPRDHTVVEEEELNDAPLPRGSRSGRGNKRRLHDDDDEVEDEDRHIHPSAVAQSNRYFVYPSTQGGGFKWSLTTNEHGEISDVDSTTYESAEEAEAAAIKYVSRVDPDMIGDNSSTHTQLAVLVAKRWLDDSQVDLCQFQSDKVHGGAIIEVHDEPADASKYYAILYRAILDTIIPDDDPNYQQFVSDRIDLSDDGDASNNKRDYILIDADRFVREQRWAPRIPTSSIYSGVRWCKTNDYGFVFAVYDPAMKTHDTATAWMKGVLAK